MDCVRHFWRHQKLLYFLHILLHAVPLIFVRLYRPQRIASLQHFHFLLLFVDVFLLDLLVDLLSKELLEQALQHFRL